MISIFLQFRKNHKCTEFQIKSKFRKKTCYPNTVAYLEKSKTHHTNLLFKLLVPLGKVDILSTKYHFYILIITCAFINQLDSFFDLI